MHASFRRPIATLLLVLQAVQLAGCSSWRPVPELTPSTPAEVQGQALRIHLSDGSTHYAKEHRFVGDSLIALNTSATGESQRRAIALSDIASLEAEDYSAGKAVLIGGVVAGVLVITGVIVYSSSDW
jgi:hypothetical protein